MTIYTYIKSMEELKEFIKEMAKKEGKIYEYEMYGGGDQECVVGEEAEKVFFLVMQSTSGTKL